MTMQNNYSTTSNRGKTEDFYLNSAEFKHKEQNNKSNNEQEITNNQPIKWTPFPRSLESGQKLR